MTIIEWKKEYAIGMASIDHEHEELIDMINDIYARLHDPVDVASVDYCLGEIWSKIASHFALEEREMRNARYDEYEAHKADHEELLDEISQLTSRFAEDPQTGRTLLQNRLSEWFRHHFATFDSRLHRKLG